VTGPGGYLTSRYEVRFAALVRSDGTVVVADPPEQWRRYDFGDGLAAWSQEDVTGVVRVEGVAGG
jgi:hypothetical protein